MHVYITFYRCFQEIWYWKVDEEDSEKKFNHLYGVLASLGRSCVGATYMSSSIVQGIWEMFIMTTALLCVKIFLHLCGPPEIINCPKVFHLILKPRQNMQNPWAINRSDKAALGEKKLSGVLLSCFQDLLLKLLDFWVTPARDSTDPATELQRHSYGQRLRGQLWKKHLRDISGE